MRCDCFVPNRYLNRTFGDNVKTTRKLEESLVFTQGTPEHIGTANTASTIDF